MNVVREAVPALKEHLMILWRNEICLEVLIESGAGKTLTYFHNYCQFFSEEVPELRSLVEMSKKLLEKWRNFVNNTIFEDKRENEFVKYRKHHKVNKCEQPL